MKKRILIVVGTRPNFIKITRFREVFSSCFDLKIVHTGQHFDANMSNVFFDQLEVYPDFFLNVPVSSPNNQIAQIMIKLEQLILQNYYPDLIIVPGDVNSALAAGLTANKMGIKLAHLEAGLRSYDRTMPEEFNRLLVDELSDYFFITEPSAINNLKIENKKGRLYFVGNTMIDTLVKFKQEISNSNILYELGIENKPFVLLTIHRPNNINNKDKMMILLEVIKEITKDYLIVFPMHPRTLSALKNSEIYERFTAVENLVLTEPLGYFEIQKLAANCKFVLTDSGGLQEETTFCQKPCLTLRENTERPITNDLGTNTLISFDFDKIISEINKITNGQYKKGQIPELWDGKSTERIFEIIKKGLN